MNCKHPLQRFSRDGHEGTCVLCGAVFKHDPAGKEKSVLIKKGIDFDSVPFKALPSERKKSIALVAQDIGSKEVRRAIGISAALLRSWGGVYTRSANDNPEAKEKPSPRPGIGTAVILAAKSIEAAAQAVTIHSQPKLPLCSICFYDIKDNPPSYIELPSGDKAWLDRQCAKGLKNILDAFAIDCRIVED